MTTQSDDMHAERCCSVCPTTAISTKAVSRVAISPLWKMKDSDLKERRVVRVRVTSAVASPQSSTMRVTFSDSERTFVTAVDFEHGVRHVMCTEEIAPDSAEAASGAAELDRSYTVSWQVVDSAIGCAAANSTCAVNGCESRQLFLRVLERELTACTTARQAKSTLT
jgi:hypothetical protein